MRKYFVTGFYLIIIGGILLLGGFLTGANRSVVWDHGFKVAKYVNETYPLSDFKNVYVETRDANVSIRLGDRYKIKVDGDKSQVPTYKVKGDTLTVTGSQKKGRIGADVFGNNHVTITIPMNKTLDNVNLRIASGIIRINDVTINNLVKSAKDLDYDSSLYLDNVTVNDAKKMNFYNAVFTLKNSKINDMTLLASSHTNINAANTTITKANLSLDQTDLNIKKSNIDSMQTMGNHSVVTVGDSTLMNNNKFRLYGSSKFTGKTLTVDGMRLSIDKGVVRYFDKSYGQSFENKTDAANLLDVKVDKGSIAIK